MLSNVDNLKTALAPTATPEQELRRSSRKRNQEKEQSNFNEENSSIMYENPD